MKAGKSKMQAEIAHLRSALGELVDAADACTVRFADKVDERLATALARAITVLDSWPTGYHEEPCCECGKPVVVPDDNKSCFVNCYSCEARY